MSEPKIYPQWIGRLGNNLFQLAATIGYAKAYNVGWGIRKGYRDPGHKADQVDRFFPHLPEFNGQFRAYNEQDFFYKPIPFHPGGVRIVGFWQSLKYFEEAQEEVRKWIKVPIVSGYEDYVSIHVRRGDYVQYAASFPPITVEYISQALSEVPNAKFAMVFSDDIAWCKQQWGSEFQYSEGRNEFEDLSLMASCGHNIISNSTLAWWGGYLNPNPNKIVVSPHHLNWFGPANPHRENTFDLIPDGWNQIKFR